MAHCAAFQCGEPDVTSYLRRIVWSSVKQLPFASRQHERRASSPCSPTTPTVSTTALPTINSMASLPLCSTACRAYRDSPRPSITMLHCAASIAEALRRVPARQMASVPPGAISWPLSSISYVRDASYRAALWCHCSRAPSSAIANAVGLCSSIAFVLSVPSTYSLMKTSAAVADVVA